MSIGISNTGEGYGKRASTGGYFTDTTAKNGNKENKLYLLKYWQCANRYDDTPPIMIECQGLYIGGKTSAKCIAKELTQNGKYEVCEIETKLCKLKGLICKTII